jgi:parvulin-like peptidyl-prolyl isomerase
MKSLLEFKSIVEEEKSDYSKFDVLIRAGLANKAQMQRIHKILDRMGEEKPNFNQADRMIIQNMFNKMVDLVSNNKQINLQARRAVKEEEEFFDTISEESVEIEDPPFILVLRRKSIRGFPNNTRVALYFNKQLNKYFSIPYGSKIDSGIQSEEVELEEEVMDTLHKIVNDKSAQSVKFASGHTRKVDQYTASAITNVHKSLNPENKKKFADMVHKSPEHFIKASDFSFKQHK